MDSMQVSLTFLECSYEGIGTSAGVKPGSVDGYEILSVSTPVSLGTSSVQMRS